MIKFDDDKKIQPTAVLSLVLVIAVLSNSCALRILEPPPEPAILEENYLPSRVAILPFVNKTSTPEAGVLVRRMFYNFFSSLN